MAVRRTPQYRTATRACADLQPLEMDVGGRAMATGGLAAVASSVGDAGLATGPALDALALVESLGGGRPNYLMDAFSMRSRAR